MIWWDPTKLYAKQFEPCEQGYLYFPRAKQGGKLVTATEYEVLTSNYRRWAGTRFMPGLMFWGLLAGSTVIALVAMMLDLSEQVLELLSYVLVIALISWFLWVYYAPYRLVRTRPDVTPPRSKSDQARAGRRLIPWFLLLWMIAMGAFFIWFGFLLPFSVGSVAWTLFWILCLVQSLRMAFQKFNDSRS